MLTSFDSILQAFRNGNITKAWRQGWNGKGQSIQLQRPDKHSKMTQPYLYIHSVTGDLIPWFPSQTDLFAVDWSYE